MVSVLAPGREVFVPTPLQDWLREHHKQLYLPCIAIAKMAQGIGKLRRAGGVDRANRLDRWLDAQVARLAGQISDAAVAQGRHTGFADLAIAALAQNAGLLLLTCNLKHFEPLGVDFADPLIKLSA